MLLRHRFWTVSVCFLACYTGVSLQLHIDILLMYIGGVVGNLLQIACMGSWRGVLMPSIFPPILTASHSTEYFLLSISGRQRSTCIFSFSLFQTSQVVTTVHGLFPGGNLSLLPISMFPLPRNSKFESTSAHTPYTQKLGDRTGVELKQVCCHRDVSRAGDAHVEVGLIACTLVCSLRPSLLRL